MNRGLSEGEGNTSSTSPSPIGNRRGGTSYLNKRIMPTLCDLCSIGIGTSMQYIDGVWLQFQHDCKEVKKLRFDDKTFIFCDECYEDIVNVKDKKKYLIKKGLIKRNENRT